MPYHEIPFRLAFAVAKAMNPVSPSAEVTSPPPMVQPYHGPHIGLEAPEEARQPHHSQRVASTPTVGIQENDGINFGHLQIKPHHRIGQVDGGNLPLIKDSGHQPPVLTEVKVDSRQASKHYRQTSLAEVRETQQRVAQVSESWSQITGNTTHSAEVFRQLNPTQLLEPKVQMDLVQGLAEEATDSLLATLGARINGLNKQERRQAADLKPEVLDKLGLSAMRFQTGGMKELRQLTLSLATLYEDHNLSIQEMTQKAYGLLDSFTSNEKRTQQLALWGNAALLTLLLARNSGIDKRRLRNLAATLVAVGIMAGCGPGQPFPETVDIISPTAEAAEEQTIATVEGQGESPEAPVAPAGINELPGGPDSSIGSQQPTEVPLQQVVDYQGKTDRLTVRSDYMDQFGHENVRGQIQVILASLAQNGFQVVESQALITAPNQVALEFSQHTDTDYQWTIGVVGQNGWWRRVNENGSFTFDPGDMSAGTRWQYFEDGLGNAVNRGYEKINGQWVMVARAGADQAVVAVMQQGGPVYEPNQVRQEEDGILVIGNVAYRQDGGGLEEVYYIADGGSLKKWNGVDRFTNVRLEKSGISGTTETVNADKLVRLADGNLAAVYGNKITAKILVNEREVRFSDNGKVDRGDGWYMAWENALVDAVQIRNGQVWQWERDGFKVMLDGNKMPIAANEIRSVGEVGWVVLNSSAMKAFIDKEGRLMQAVDQLALVGNQVMGWNGAELVATDMSPMEFKANMPGHERLESIGRVRGPKLGLVINEQALGLNIDALRFTDEGRFRQFFLEMALARMKDDGYIDQSMSFHQFTEWLSQGNNIILKELDAYNALTGEPETFHNASVKSITIYITHTNDKLPIKGKTRYAPGLGPTAHLDAYYYVASSSLYLIFDINGQTVGNFISNPTIESINILNASVTQFIRLPPSYYDSAKCGLTSDGRKCVQAPVDKNGSDIVFRNLFPPHPVQVNIAK
jgi:hypothetical protein